MLGKLFEPYIVHDLPHLFDTYQYVREVVDNCAKAVTSKLSSHGVKPGAAQPAGRPGGGPVENEDRLRGAAGCQGQCNPRGPSLLLVLYIPPPGGERPKRGRWVWWIWNRTHLSSSAQQPQPLPLPFLASSSHLLALYFTSPPGQDRGLHNPRHQHERLCDQVQVRQSATQRCGSSTQEVRLHLPCLGHSSPGWGPSRLTC